MCHLVAVVCCCLAAKCSFVVRTARIDPFQRVFADGTEFSRQLRLADEMVSADWTVLSWLWTLGYRPLEMRTDSDSRGPRCSCDVVRLCWAHAKRRMSEGLGKNFAYHSGTDFQRIRGSLCLDSKCSFEHRWGIALVWDFSRKGANFGIGLETPWKPRQCMEYIKGGTIESNSTSVPPQRSHEPRSHRIRRMKSSDNDPGRRTISPRVRWFDPFYFPLRWQAFR